MIKLGKCWLFNKKIILLILLLLLPSITLSNAQHNTGKNTNDQSSMFLLPNDNDNNTNSNININLNTNNNTTTNDNNNKNKTDNIVLNETEKIIKVHRTDQILLNDTFMNENQYVRNLLPYTKNDSETISMNNNNNITKINSTITYSTTINDKTIIENNTLKLPFKEFLLDEDEDGHFLNNITNNNNKNNNNNNNTLSDSENIYRVAKIKRKINFMNINRNDNDNNKIQSNVIVNHRVKHADNVADNEDDHVQDVNDSITIKMNNTNLIQYQLITHLFDHLQWNNSEIQQILGDPKLLCSQDIQKYLNAIYNEESWALKVMDSSGRYRGQLFFGNNLWMGARRFCYQIEKDFATDKQKPVKMGFFVTKMLIPIADLLVVNQPLFVGQCLPNSCTIDDIQNILEVDPSAKTLLNKSMESNGNNSSSSKTEFKILNVRKVPGNYNLWTDRKFYFLIILLSIISVFVIIGTVLEFSNNKKSTKSETSLLTKNSIDMINNNQNNNHNNNNNNININGSKMLDNSSKLFNDHLNHNNNNNNNNRIDMELNGSDRDLNDDIKIEHDDINNVKTKRKCGIFRQILSSFDLIANSKSILSTNGVTENTVACVHGMRFFSMLWIIMVHSYLSLYAKSENKYSKNLTERSFWYQLVGNATYSVDTFFFISGLLVTLLFLRAEKLQSNKRSVLSSIQKVILAVFYRFIRLTPALIFVIIFTEVTLNYSSNNTVFPPSALVDHLICPQYWWRTLLYIQNWYPFAELCMSWSWYLANDMQFFIFAIIVLLISTRFLKTSFTIVIIFLILSWITTALVSLSYNYQIKISEPLNSFGFLYDRPWTRLGPYIMGMLAGYIIYRVNKPPKLSTIINLILWITSIAIIFIVVFGIWNGSLDIHTTALYFSLSHTAWGLALIWITLACKWKLAIYIDNFLSFTAFLPFSRLTYCVYLIHPITQVIVANNLDGALNIQHSFILTIFLGNSIIAYTCAFLISLFFEAPLVKVLRIFYRR